MQACVTSAAKNKTRIIFAQSTKAKSNFNFHANQTHQLATKKLFDPYSIRFPNAVNKN